MNSSALHCPDCGAEVPQSAPEGLCPACLLRAWTPATDDVSGGAEIEQIGPYAILEELGQGGMGLVYRALQLEPIERLVALKVIKAGMDTRQVIARFEAERQALALMDHPNIARVLDAGSTEQGRPYFVMELVEGEPLTTFCDRHRLSTRVRLEVAALVCDAVQHAHQKGIIHRDLKPSNVLAFFDADGKVQIRIIDFGIAKATATDLMAESLATVHGQFLGTPQYMSPEQAGIDATDIDTRTDIYSLGVILYELLTGGTPLREEAIRRCALVEIQRLVREGETERPSVRVESDAVTGDVVAERRATQVERLRRELRGDLDWIVLKALDKERARRYGTAAALAADLRRYLNHVPVEARPASRLYQIRKLVRRNRAAVAVAAVFVITLLAGTVISLRLAWRAMEAEALANRRLVDAEAVPDFLIEALASPDPRGSGLDVRVADVLDQAAEAARTKFGSQPRLRSRILTAIAKSYTNLGLYSESAKLIAEGRDGYAAEPQGQEALARAAREHAVSCRLNHDREGALREYWKAYQTLLQLHGPAYPETIQVLTEYIMELILNRQFGEAERLINEVEDRTRKGELAYRDTHPILLDMRMLRLEGLDRNEETLDFYNIKFQLIVHQNPSRDYGAYWEMGKLCRTLAACGRFEQAVVATEERALYAQQLLGPGHRSTLLAITRWMEVLAKLGRTAEAVFLGRRFLPHTLPANVDADTKELETALRALEPQLSIEQRLAVDKHLAVLGGAGKIPEQPPDAVWIESAAEMPVILAVAADAWLRRNRREEAALCWQRLLAGEQLTNWMRLTYAQKLAAGALESGAMERAEQLLEPFLTEEYALHPLFPRLVATALNCAALREKKEDAAGGLEVRMRVAKLVASSRWLPVGELWHLHQDLMDRALHLKREPASLIEMTSIISAGLRERERLQRENPVGLDDRPLDSWHLILSLGRMQTQHGFYEEAEQSLLAVNEAVQGNLTDPHANPHFPWHLRALKIDVAAALASLYETWHRPEAGSWREQTLPRLVLESLQHAAAAVKAKKIDEALSFYSPAGPHLARATQLRPDILQPALEVGRALHHSGHLRVAREILTTVKERASQRFRVEDGVYMEALNFLRQIETTEGNHAVGMELLRELHTISRNVRGEGHPATLHLVEQMAQCHHRLGNFETAAEVVRSYYEAHVKARGETHQTTMVAREQMAARLIHAGRLHEALAAIDQQIRLAGAHPNLAASLRWKAQYYEAAVYRALGDLNRSERLLREVVSVLGAAGLPKDDGDAGRIKETLKISREALKGIERSRGRSFPPEPKPPQPAVLAVP